MAGKIAILDFDMESRISSKNYEFNDPKNRDTRIFVEFIGFFLESNHPVFLEGFYDNEYFEHLSFLGITPRTSSSGTGVRVNLISQGLADDQLVALNSKTLFSHFPLVNREQILGCELPFLVKEKLNLAGMGNFLVTENLTPENIERIFKTQEEVLVEPFHSRIVDISFKNFEDCFKIFYQYCSPKGQFIGFGYDPIFEEEIIENWGIHYDAPRFQLQNLLKDLGINGNYEWNFDGYFYLESKTLRFRPVCELNFRKSMSSIFKTLGRNLKSTDIGEFFFSKHLNKLEILKKSFTWEINGVKVYRLNPFNHPFTAIWIEGEREEVIKFKKKYFPKKLPKSVFQHPLEMIQKE